MFKTDLNGGDLCALCMPPGGAAAAIRSSGTGPALRAAPCCLEELSREPGVIYAAWLKHAYICMECACALQAGPGTIPHIAGVLCDQQAIVTAQVACVLIHHSGDLAFPSLLARAPARASVHPHAATRATRAAGRRFHCAVLPPPNKISTRQMVGAGGCVWCCFPAKRLMPAQCRRRR